MLKILIWGTGVSAQKYVLGYHKQMQFFFRNTMFY